MNRKTTNTFVEGNGRQDFLIVSEKSDDRESKESRVEAKQAILRELNKDLTLTAERVKLKNRGHQSEALDAGSGDAKPSVTSEETAIRNENKKGTSVSKIPTTNTGARSRRRALKEKSNVDVRNYRPGYTWNRGGRVKELRIRCIARKFLYLWRSHVFGRIWPSNAIQHYHKGLVKKMFGKWYDDWWEIRQEWRLLIRAECHHRYVIWGRIISAWKEFVLLNRIKMHKEKEADTLYNRNILCKALSAWKTYQEYKKSRKQLCHVAFKHRQECLVLNAWRKWQQQMINQDHYREMDATALQFWAYRLQAEHWFIWREKFYQKQKEKQKENLSNRYYQQTLVKKSLRKWLFYIKQRKIKISNLEYGKQIYKISLKIRFLKQWRDRLRQVQSHASLQAQIDESGERFQKRKFFERWKQFVNQKKRDKEKLQRAKIFHRKHLLVYGLSAFRLNSVHARIQQMRKNMAAQLYYRHVIQRYWNTWLARCETNEELELALFTTKARRHYRNVLLRRGIQSLVLYKQWRVHRKDQYIKADAHFYLHQIPKYLYNMKIFVEICKIERENEEKSCQFFREKKITQFFYHWVNSTEQSKENRLADRMAFLHYEDTLVQRFFHYWVSRTAEELQIKEKEEQAIDHSNWTHCQKHFVAWRDYIRDIRRGEENEVKAVQFRRKMLLKQYCRQWRQYHDVKKEKLKLTKTARDHYKSKIGRLIFHHLKISVQKSKEIQPLVEAKYKIKCEELKSRIFKQWLDTVEEQKSEREKNEAAGIHHNIHVVHRVFTTWHRYAVIHSFKKAEAIKLEQEAKDHLKKVLTKQYFNKWCATKDRNILLRLRIEQAANHYHNKTCTKVIRGWLDQTHLSRRKNLLARQAKWFHNVRLTAKYYLLWKEYFNEAEKNKDKTHLALWHWSLNLQKKVLEGWCSYIEERKRKKERISTAMNNRRMRLLKNGVSQWLNVASELSDMRSKFAAQQQAKTAYDKFQLMQKYALYWKHLTVKNMSIRGGPRPISQLPADHNTTASKQHQQKLFFPISPSRRLKDPVLLSTTRETSHHLNSKPVPVQSQLEAIQLTKVRKQPRRPAFLVESLKNAGLFTGLTESSEDSEEKEKQIGDENNLCIVKEEIDHQENSEGAVKGGGKLIELSPPISDGPSEPQNITNNSEFTVNGRTEDKDRRSVSPSNKRPTVPRILHSSPLSGRQDLRQSTLALSTLSGGHDASHMEYLKGSNEVLLLKPGDFLKTAHPTTSLISQDISDTKQSTKERSQQMTNEEELIYIRNTLKKFEENKKKLKKLQKQCRHLSVWLKDGSRDEDVGDDLDVHKVEEELEQVQKEVKVLKESLGKDKVECQRLVERSKILVSLVQNTQ